MSVYYAVTYSPSIEHHGIKGQKWGKRNGPPYPLDAGDHSASEKKAGWRRSLRGRRRKGYLGNYGYSDDEISNARKKYTKESRNRNKVESTSSIGQTKGYWKNAPKQTIAQRMYDEERSEYKKEFGFKLTDKQKKYLKIGAAVVVTGLVAYGAYKVYTNGGRDVARRLMSDRLQNKVPDEMLKQTYLNAKSSEVNTPKAFDKIVDLTGDGVKDAIDNRVQKGIVDPDSLFDEKLWKNFSSIESASTRFYTSSEGFGPINTLLRNLDTSRYREDSLKKAQEAIPQITQAISQSKLDKEITTFRGVDQEGIEAMFPNINWSSTQGQDLVGKVFKENAFYSSSPKFQKKFTEYGAGGIPGCKLTTICPKGTQALYIGDKSLNPQEKELLLQRGTEFKIHKVIMNPTTNLPAEIIMEVVEQLK